MTTVLSILATITRGALLTAALIVLIRLIFRRVLTAKAKYYLWLLLALRLVLPAVPASPVSLLNFLPERTAFQQVPAAPKPLNAPDAPDPVLWEHEPEAAPQEPEVPDTPAQADLSGTPGMVEEFPVSPEMPDAPAAPTVPRTAILFWVWLGGMGIALAVYGILYCITARKLRRLPVCTDSDTLRVFLRLKRACGVQGRVRLVSGGAGMLGGLLRPTIVLPVEKRGEDVAPIIVHELMHYKYKDLWVFALLRLLTAVYWFNPVVWLCFRRARQDGEAACDQRVLETGLVRPDCYAGALYEEGVLHTRKGPLLQTTFGGDRHSLKRRIRLIATFKSPKVWVTALAVILAVMITACTMTGATSGTQEPSSSAEPQESQLNFDTYMEPLQPPNGVFGLTFDEHVDRGLLNPEDGTMEHYTRDDCDLSYSLFRTTMELGGQTVPIDYNFSQTVLSEEEILTQVFVTPPEDVPLGTWLSSISDPWLSGLTQNTDLNGWEWNTAEYVADFLTEEQLQTVIDAEMDMGKASSSPEFPKTEEDAEHRLKTRWRVVTAFSSGPEDENSKLIWQFNGTGAALIRAAHASGGPSASTLEGTTDSLTFSPYVLDNDSLTYENTTWDMTFSQTVAAQELDMDTWKSSDFGQPTIYLDQPLSDHPEVERITYTFNVKNPALILELSRVEIEYDPEQIDYESLIAQRTQELGTPEGSYENNTFWTFGDIQFAIYPGKHDLQERLMVYVDRSEELLPTQEQVDAYLSDIQPPNGHYGWTFEEHVEAGLLDPEQGELVENDGTIRFHVFETEMELGGEMVDMEYHFTETMASWGTGRQVLTEVHVDPPSNVPLSQWLTRFPAPWKDRMVRLPESSQWNGMLTVGPFLTDAQREYIAQALVEDGRTAASLEEAYQYLDNWNMAMNFYEAARGWVYNGTGAALYLTAQEMD